MSYFLKKRNGESYFYVMRGYQKIMLHLKNKRRLNNYICEVFILIEKKKVIERNQTTC